MRQSNIVCFGCKRSLRPGDQYIRDTLGGFATGDETPGGSEVDELLGAALSGTDDGTLIFCEDCTERRPDGRYQFEVVPDVPGEAGR